MKLKLLFTFLIVLSSFIISAQQVVISGTITDEKDGSQLPGVNVVIKGTTKGVITSVEGFYTISAPPGSTLVFSFVGYSNQEIIVGNANATNNIALSQVVSLPTPLPQ